MLRHWIGEDDPEIRSPCCWCMWDTSDDTFIVVAVVVVEPIDVAIVAVVVMGRRKLDFVCW